MQCVCDAGGILCIYKYITVWRSMYECIHAYEVWKTVVVLVCVGACLHECVYFVSVHVLTKKREDDNMS